MKHEITKKLYNALFNLFYSDNKEDEKIMNKYRSEGKYYEMDNIMKKYITLKYIEKNRHRIYGARGIGDKGIKELNKLLENNGYKKIEKPSKERYFIY